MVHRRQRLRLLLEAPQSIRVRYKFRRPPLTATSRFSRVSRAKYLTHPPAPMEEVIRYRVSEVPIM